MHSGCGYCTALQRCQPGTSYGPDEQGACSDASWRFTQCDAPPPVFECAQIRGCTECLATPGCGYCDIFMECYDLDFLGECELVTDPSSVACRQADCRNIEDCDDCAEDPSCGYCLEANECRLRDEPGGCVLEIDPNSNTCKEALCQARSSCDACIVLYINLYNLVDDIDSSCQWCESTHICSYQQSCPGSFQIYLYGSSGCPPQNDCPTHRSCDTCINDDRCGWCSSSSVCTAMDATGVPYGGYHGQCDRSCDE